MVWTTLGCSSCWWCLQAYLSNLVVLWMKYKKYQQEFIHFVDIVCQNTVHVINLSQNKYFQHFSEIIPIHKNVYYETKTSLNKTLWEEIILTWFVNIWRAWFSDKSLHRLHVCKSSATVQRLGVGDKCCSVQHKSNMAAKWGV